MNEVAVVPNVSLYKIEEKLLELVDRREMADTDEGKAAADGEIRAYVEAEVRKVDGILAYMQHCQHLAKMAFAETERLAAIGRVWSRREEWLKGATLRAMTAFGIKQLEGSLGSFSVRGNPPSVEITDPSLVPPEFMMVNIKMSFAAWRTLIGFLQRHASVVEALAPELVSLKYLSEVTASKSAIAAELKRTEPCVSCKGAGCEACGGEGRVLVGVAGARLVTDRVHLQVK